ncbi:MAG: AsnC family protein [Gammaproteobacteria bacterium]|jgi:DNA-binding Lrp family transcriptional regulator|nr:AsnC family protein [Gammaproteobacteria bacterium]MBT3724186.1 AsnC family protein [Gammaproteobacteria bacterium]MBT4075543.1 AsnC family protein [Gammaproteobacteria bacterium]MBT4195381.1 AsnC family protein [Gammaproteobacteria bacterium]MBT4449684.1 AsnC family protein [Gammaproteobacteria bacterium]
MDMKVLNPNLEQALIAVIEQGLPLVPRPYADLALQIGCSEQEVIDGLQTLKNRGDIKRFGVVVRHRKLGYRANGMVVWNVPDEDVKRLGHCIGQYSFVTLCYRRPRQLPEWGYNLFTMVHGRNKQEVEEKTQLLVEQCGLDDINHEILFSSRCFKQRGARYISNNPLADIKISPPSSKK